MAVIIDVGKSERLATMAVGGWHVPSRVSCGFLFLLLSSFYGHSGLELRHGMPSDIQTSTSAANHLSVYEKH